MKKIETAEEAVGVLNERRFLNLTWQQNSDSTAVGEDSPSERYKVQQWISTEHLVLLANVLSGYTDALEAELAQVKQAAQAVIDNNGGPIDSIYGEDTHVMVAMGDFEALGAVLAHLQPGAAKEAKVQPIDMLLFCPNCNAPHIDAPQPEKDWTNPPHRSHECQNCEWVWRPSDVPTNGVASIQTKGQHDLSADPYMRVGV